jgi:competence protein ComEC
MIWILVFSSLLVLGVAVSISILLQKSTASVYKWRYVSGTAIILIMLSLGYVVTYCHTSRINPHPIADIKGDSAVYVGMVADPVVVKDKTVSVLLEMNAMRVGDSMRSVTGKVLASIVKDGKSEALQYGDRVIFTGEVKGYDEPKNPDQFNYKRYQLLHHIDHHVYLRQDDWRLAGLGFGNVLLAKVYRVRAYSYLSSKK